MSILAACAALVVVALLLYLARGAWRARQDPKPPSAASAISQMPDPPDVGTP